MKTIKFSSQPENITIVEKFLEETRNELNIGDTFDDIFLVLIEAATNAMRHGNKGDENTNVEITYRLDEKCKTLSFIIKDEGSGFDHNNVPDPTAPENLERTHGRGVFLMKELTKAIVFTDNGATVEMQFEMDWI